MQPVAGDWTMRDNHPPGNGMRQDVPPSSSNGNAFYNLGNACHNRGEFEPAAEAYREAVRFNPRDADSWNNLGKTLKELNRLEEAIAAYSRALEIRPEMAVAHCNRAIALLAAGRLDEGWREYEWRWRLFSPAGMRRRYGMVRRSRAGPSSSTANKAWATRFNLCAMCRWPGRKPPGSSSSASRPSRSLSSIAGARTP